jgi:hypothetical protein
MIKVLAVGDQGPQAIQRRELVATGMPQAGSVHEPFSELGIGG